jgi:transcriptional regulator with XRE-family HTH domain
MNDVIHNKAKLGESLKVLRMSKDMTVEESARRANISTSFLSLIERGQRLPDAVVLKDLLGAYNTSLAWFFCEVERRGREKVVYGSADSILMGGKRGKRFAVELLFPMKEGWQIELVKITLRAGGKLFNEFAHEGQECGYVMTGEIVLTLDGMDYPVRAGQSFRYEGKQFHAIRNDSKKTAEIIYVITPPNY